MLLKEFRDLLTQLKKYGYSLDEVNDAILELEKKNIQINASTETVAAIEIVSLIDKWRKDL